MKTNLQEQRKNETLEEIMHEIYSDKSWREIQDLYSSIGCSTWKPKMCYENLELLSDVIKDKFGKLYDKMAEDIDKAYDH